MKLNKSALVVLFTSLGFKTVANWTVERFTEKTKELCKVINDPEEIDLDSITDADAKKLAKTIAKEAKAAKGKVEIEVVDDSAPAEKPTKSEKPAPAAEKPTKKSAPAKADEDEDETPAEKPTKKTDKKTETKPAAKPAKAAGAGKDRFGGRVGSLMSKINLSIGKKPKTTDQIAEETGVKKVSVSAQLFTLLGKGFIEKSEKGWALPAGSK